MTGRVRLGTRLGKGGMAEVWRATVDGHAGEVVVRRVLRHLAGDARLQRMLLDEARLLQRFRHDHIVRLLEIAGEPDDPLLVMELVDGRSVYETIRTAGAFEPVLAVSVMASISRALGYVHALSDDNQPLRLVHRDVSPSNILIGFDGVAKLIDFGVAREESNVTRVRTESGVLRGKLAIAAPEQLSRQVVDHRADLFAAGVVLHEMLTGQRLFAGKTDAETIDRIQTGVIHPPSLRNPRVPPELDRITLRALARDPALRYQSGEALAAELEALLDGNERARLAAFMSRAFLSEPTSATSAGARPKRRLVALSIGVVLVAAAATVGIMMWLQRPMQRAIPAAAPTAVPETPRLVAPSPSPPPPTSSLPRPTSPPVKHPPKRSRTQTSHDENDPLEAAGVHDPFKN